MEAFSLLKYWRGGGGGGGGIGDVAINSKPTATIVTTVDSSTTTTTTTEEEIQNDNTTTENDNDDGPFFDLEFSLDEEDDDDDEEEEEEDEEDDNKSTKSDSEEDEDEREFNFTLSSESSNDRTDNLSLLSPSDGLFFKGKLVPVESGQNDDSDVTTNSAKPQFSLLKSATKLRVFMLGLKKSKSNIGSNVDSVPTKKLFTVKFKVEEVPIVSLFTRDNSSRSASNKTTTTTTATTTTTKQSSENETTMTSSNPSSSEEKRFSKEVMQKYLKKKVKPLYVRVSRRYGEKLRLAGQVSVEAISPVNSESPATEEVEAPVPAAVVGKSGGGLNLPAGLRVVCKHLGKSRSASSAVVAAAQAPGLGTTAAAGSRRRDDSLIQQQDGIQSAILHCKRSFNASRDSESSLLSRCVSDPSNEKKCLDLSRRSSDGIQRA